MRDDIRNVIHERPKSNRTWISKRGRVKQVLLDADGGHFNESAEQARPGRQKYTNTRFQAVDHFLIRNVGRPWADVFSEICAKFDVRTKDGLEVRNHLATTVGLKGEPVNATGLFVDPRSGLLVRKLP